MVSSLLYVGVIAPIAVILAFLIPILAARGKWLKCPDCGEAFKAPAVDQRRTGIGVSPPGLGSVKCPKCGQLRSRRDYLKVPAPAQSPPT
ncbi:MAG: hypothetical protein JRN06_02720 [Nitrososphaerota archaeon]|nr:hypothetical protein [Nitrososphaerota archaeon]MDG7023230.1 hypothetical protein [Nitrososphaerota archaeon]